MEIDNFKVYDLQESLTAAGLPMKAEYDAQEFQDEAGRIGPHCGTGTIQKSDTFRRAARLAANLPGTGHNNFLSGILVSANITATNAWWLQFGRYHFAQIVSSQSKMHRLRQMIGNKHPFKGGKFPFEGGDVEFFNAFYKLAFSPDTTDEALILQCPLGLRLTARITTNYLQLKTIYRQRRKHRLTEWQEFCEWIEELPFADSLICYEKLNPKIEPLKDELRRIVALLKSAATDMRTGRVYQGPGAAGIFKEQAQKIQQVIEKAEAGE